MKHHSTCGSFARFLLVLAFASMVACIPSPSLLTPIPVPASPTPVPTTATAVITAVPPTFAPTAVPASPSAARTATASKSSIPVAKATEDSHTGWEVRNLLVGPGQPGRLYVLLANRGTDAFPSERMRFLVSDDDGATWTAFPGGLPAPAACVRNVNLDYTPPGMLYASTCTGLYRWSSDHWVQVSGQATWMVAVTYGQSKNIWAPSYGSSTGAVLQSKDGGMTWQAASNGLVHFNGVANVAIDPRDGQTLYAIIWPKYGGSYLRRGTRQGNWVMMPAPLNNAQIDIGMTIDGATGALYISVIDAISHLGQTRWQMWRTTNPTADLNSIVWERIHDFGQDGWVTLLASGNTPQGLALFARVSPSNGESYVVRSRDGGKTWETMPVP